MLGTVIIRELQDYLKSHRLWVCVLIVNVVVLVITVSHQFEYEERLSVYHKHTNREVENDLWQIVKPPEPLSLFANGMENYPGHRVQYSWNGVTFGKNDLSLDGGGYRGGSSSYANLDIAFIVSVLLSLFVIFLSYDTISGEKKHGTLRVVFSNAIPRHIFLFGKILSAILVLSIVVTFLYTLSTIMLLLSSSISLDGSDFIRIVLMCTTSVLYLVFFYLLSLLMSVKINSPVTGLAVLLLFWLSFVHVYPSAGAFLVDTMYKNPSRRAVLREKTHAYYSGSEEITGQIKKNGRDMSDNQITYNMTQVIHRFEEHVRQNRIREKRITDFVIRFSPPALYTMAVESIALTGFPMSNEFHRQVVNYWEHVYSPKSTELRWREYHDRVKNPPAFQYERFHLLRTLGLTSMPVFILVILNIILFLTIHVSFLRKDVR